MRFPFGSSVVRLVAAHRALWILCAGYLMFLLVYRPVTPFEWDEVQYQRALDSYDVAAHSPHPPGAPVYVAVSRILRLVVRDAQLATQLLTILSAVAALAFLHALVVRLDGTQREGLVAAGVLALLPGFAFHANVGMTDAPAAACTLAVLLVVAATIEAPKRVPWLAVVAALSVGVRPQILPAIAAPGIWAITVVARAKQFRPLARALAWGAGLTAVIWGAAILITGPARYLAAVRHHAHWMASMEFAARLPAARLTAIARYWLISAFGTWELAAAFWLMVLAGAVSLWYAGRRRALLFVLLAAVPYLVAGTFTFNMLSAVRYELPGLAVLVVLVGGASSALIPRAGQVAVLCIIGLWAAASLAWGMRVYNLRREPAPVWASLQWARDNVDPASTVIVSDGSARPHVEYVLGRAGYRVAEWAPGAVYPNRGPAGEAFVTLTRLPIPGWEVLFARDWHSRRLLQLAFWRYGSYTVQRPAPVGAGAPAFSPAWQVEGDTYVLWGIGQVRLPDDAGPATATICPLNAAVTVVGAATGRVAVQANECRGVAMRPGRSGGLFVIAPVNLHAVMRPLVFERAPGLGVSRVSEAAVTPAADYLRLLAENDTPLPPWNAPLQGAAPATPQPIATAKPTPTPTPAPQPLYLLPVARTSGFYGAQWRTEMVVANPTGSAMSVTFELLLSGKDNSAPRRTSLDLAAAETRTFPDALGELFGADGAGALRIRSAGPQVRARLRTYDAARKAPRGPFLEGRPESAALGPGRPAVLANLASDSAAKTRKRTNIGLLNVGTERAEVELILRGADGAVRGVTSLALGPLEFRQLNNVFPTLGVREAAAGSITVATATRGAAILAYATVVRNEPAGVTYVLP